MTHNADTLEILSVQEIEAMRNDMIALVRKYVQLHTGASTFDCENDMHIEIAGQMHDALEDATQVACPINHCDCCFCDPDLVKTESHDCDFEDVK